MLGIDIIAVDRVERLACRQWYVRLWLNPEEQEYLNRKPNRGESIAAAISAKEAVMKACGRGFGQGVRPVNIRLAWEQTGAPFAEFDGRRFAISVTHSDGLAAAVAMDLCGIT